LLDNLYPHQRWLCPWVSCRSGVGACRQDGGQQPDESNERNTAALHHCFVGIDDERFHCKATCASRWRSFRTPASTRLAGANLRNIRRRFASPPAAYRSFGRGASAAFSTTSATTPASSAASITSFSLLPRAARTSRYSSSFESGCTKLASNCVFVYAGSMTETRMPLVRNSW